MTQITKYLIFFTSALLIFGACAHLRPDSNTLETLQKRVQAEWEARARGDWGAVYEMTVEDFRKAMKRDKFLRRNYVSVTKFSIKDISISESGEEGTAEINFTTNQMGFNFTFTKKEKWLWEDGEWRLKLSSAKGISPFDTNKSQIPK
ncbi:hypothetical protein QUF80_14760 [Desulfococcaceae bacterium HSG8]|nr:hypothetical protein [Desulfococcaceae bacterium HSG8]